MTGLSTLQALASGALLVVGGYAVWSTVRGLNSRAGSRTPGTGSAGATHKDGGGPDVGRDL